MRIVEEFPREVRTIEETWIRLSDGVRLSAKIWLPEDAESDPVPAVLEYLPYRYQDGTADRDALTHPYFAGHGYACVRVDMRGAGNSEGVLLGEYLKREQDDALEIIDWITSQTWCSGTVGIIGISWGGFNGLQIAARQPEALKAIVSICSTDDRYADDIHYMGGSMLCDNIAWSTYMFSINTTPPDPRLHGAKWKEVWLQRLRGSGLWLSDWIEHQHRDEFYKHGSVCENYDDIKCAVYAVGGWADGYSNAVFRLLSNLKAPSKGLVGPWAHKYPHIAGPGPSIGFLQECLRWWDHWLKGIDTGIMDEPRLRCWMQDPVPPRTYYAHRPGRWVAEDTWPSSRIVDRRFFVNKSGLGETGEAPAAMEVSSPETVGIAGGIWCPHGEEPDQPSDQRKEAGGSLNFDSGFLEADLEILGAPIFEVDVSSRQETGQLIICLNEILPDGAITRISYGILNLAHRDGHQNPQPLVPGDTYRIRIRLNEIAHRFAAGNRIRLSISTAYWPVVWPSPEKSTLRATVGTATLNLPTRTGKASDQDLREFDPPESAPPLKKTVSRKPSFEWAAVEDLTNGVVVSRQWFDEGATTFDEYDGWKVDSTHEEIYTIHPDDPNSAKCGIVWTERFSRDDWNVSSRTQSIVTSSATHFHLEARLKAWLGDDLVHEQEWEKSFRRRLV